MWEHAYYLQYKNARPEYLKQIWQVELCDVRGLCSALTSRQVVNWKDVAARYEAAKKA